VSASDYSKQLSIICPISDMAGRLGHLNDWLNQVDFNCTQVILVHDIRDEKTGSELKSIISKINSPALILKEGLFGTAGGARNSARSSCEGEWICFWDSDDQPNYHLVLNALDSVHDVIIGEFCIENPTGATVKVPHGSTQGQSLSRMSFNPGLWRMAFRAEMIKNISFPEITMGEDQCFLAQIDWNSLKIKYVHEVYYNYFSGWDNQTTGRKKSRLPLLESMRFLEFLLKQKKGNEKIIRNMASRQFLTLLKSRGVKVKFMAIFEIVKFFGGHSGFLKQLNSIKDMTFYLLKSPAR